MMFCIIVLAIILPFVKHVDSHAALLEPPARNVLYRMGYPSAPYHENDDYLVCVETGATTICPPCGDTLDAQYPRPHEAGGMFANGVITRSYVAGQEIDIYVNVTQSHGGYIELKLCPNNDIYHPVEQGCLDMYPLQVAGKRSSKVPVTSPYGGREEIRTVVKLPEGLTCSQCVMQMSFNTDQYLPSRVLFRNCADFEIVSNDLPEVASSATSATYKQPTSTRRTEKYNRPIVNQRKEEEYYSPATQRNEEYYSPVTQRNEEYYYPTENQSSNDYNQPAVDNRNEDYNQPAVNNRNEEYDQPPVDNRNEEYDQPSANRRKDDVLGFQRSDVEAYPSGYSQRRARRGHVTPYRSRFQTRNEKFSHRFSQIYK